jgi:hypothetical protein
MVQKYSKELRFSEKQYIDWGHNLDAGGKGDFPLRCHKFKIVKTRRTHFCMCERCRGNNVIFEGALALCETALIVEQNRWGTVYYSIKCIDMEIEEEIDYKFDEWG